MRSFLMSEKRRRFTANVVARCKRAIWAWPLLLSAMLGSCAGNPLPPPNSIRTTFDRGAHAIRLYVSNAQMPRDARLVDANGAQYPLALVLVSGPHVNYSAPPSVGLGAWRVWLERRRGRRGGLPVGKSPTRQRG